MSYYVVKDLRGLNEAICAGMDYAYPVENNVIAKAVRESRRDGAGYFGGALITIESTTYQIMYR